MRKTSITSAGGLGVQIVDGEDRTIAKAAIAAAGQ